MSDFYNFHDLNHLRRFLDAQNKEYYRRNGNMKNDIAIATYLKYEQDTFIQSLVAIATGKIKCDGPLLTLNNEKSTEMQDKAMAEVGIVGPQINCADATFFDFSLSNERKLEILAMCQDVPKSRIDFLKMRIAEAGRIPDRMTIA